MVPVLEEQRPVWNRAQVLELPEERCLDESRDGAQGLVSAPDPFPVGAVAAFCMKK